MLGADVADAAAAAAVSVRAASSEPLEQAVHQAGIGRRDFLAYPLDEGSDRVGGAGHRGLGLVSGPCGVAEQPGGCLADPQEGVEDNNVEVAPPVLESNPHPVP